MFTVNGSLIIIQFPSSYKSSTHLNSLETFNYYFYFQLWKNIHLSKWLLHVFLKLYHVIANDRNLGLQSFKISAHSYTKHAHSILFDALFWIKHCLALFYQTHFTNDWFGRLYYAKVKGMVCGAKMSGNKSYSLHCLAVWTKSNHSNLWVSVPPSGKTG